MDKLYFLKEPNLQKDRDLSEDSVDVTQHCQGESKLDVVDLLADVLCLLCLGLLDRRSIDMQ